jgi:hypothetical protein
LPNRHRGVKRARIWPALSQDSQKGLRRLLLRGEHLEEASHPRSRRRRDRGADARGPGAGLPSPLSSPPPSFRGSKPVLQPSSVEKEGPSYTPLACSQRSLYYEPCRRHHLWQVPSPEVFYLHRVGPWRKLGAERFSPAPPPEADVAGTPFLGGRGRTSPGRGSLLGSPGTYYPYKPATKKSSSKSINATPCYPLLPPARPCYPLLGGDRNNVAIRWGRGVYYGNIVATPPATPCSTLLLLATPCSTLLSPARSCYPLLPPQGCYQIFW